VKFKREKIKREKMDPDDYHRLEFHLNRVKCMEETDGIGRDKILLGGYLIRPDGFITEIPSFLVSDQFHSGDTVVYTTGASSPGRVLASSPLYGPWPGSFGLILLLTEQDPGGGMGEMLTELGARIREEVADAIIAANAAGADARDEHLSAHRAAMVDEIVMWVLTELAVWVAGLYDEPDDLISCESLVVTLPNATPAAVEALASTENMPAGTCASPTRDVMFAGEGGRYNCRLHWRAIM
jgi:hypothetical protein